MRSGNFSYLYMGVIVPLCIIIPLALVIYKYRSLPSALRIFGWYLALSGVTSVVTKFLAVQNNLPVLHIYTCIEFMLFALFYRKILEGTIMGRLAIPFIIIFAALCVANAIFLQSIYTYNSYTRSLEALFIIGFAISYFLKSLDSLEKPSQLKQSITWINAALLIYFSGALVLFIVSNMVISDVPLGRELWNINATLVLIMYILFTVGLWKAEG
jgi:hypothetical protein